MSFETEIVDEGLAKIEIPEVERLRGPGKKSSLPFYNPLMRTNRDITVMVALSTAREYGRKILDGLAATGVSGIRLALEANGDSTITLNDSNPFCHDLIMRNVARNKVRNCTAACEDLNSILAKENYDFVDVDPFGSPVRFVEGAMRGTINGGIAALTATDAAVLCGARKRACIRRYDSQPRKTEYCHELGLRILLGYIARVAARFDRGIKPLVCFSTDHYFRTIIRIEKGARRADRNLENLGYLHVGDSLDRRVNPEVGVAGPLWSGTLFDVNLLETMRLPSHFPHKASKLLGLWREEAASPPLFYTAGEVAREFSIEPPAISKVIEMLREEGFQATKTHFRPDAFKTNADAEAMKALLKT